VDGTDRLRHRARDAVRNDWAAESGNTKWVTALVGTGIVPRWENEQYDVAWEKFAATADADGVFDAYGLQTLGVRGWLDGGEVFLRRRSRRLDSRLPAPLQVQVLESEMCPMFDADTHRGMAAGNRIRQGIELNRYDEAAAYWMYREHPGDGNTLAVSKESLVRVAASEISHVYDPRRAGQLRGVSQLAPVLLRLRSTADYEDTVLERQKLANLFVSFVTRPLPVDWKEMQLDPDTGMPKVWDDLGRALKSLEPGIMQELLPGENVSFANPPEAGTTYSDYVRTNLMGVAAGLGMPYELLSGDIRNVSDRTLRVLVNEFRRFAEQRQWQVIVPMLCQPIVRWWAEAMVLSGQAAPSELEALKSPQHSPHGWEYIHPTQDVQGKILARDAGFTSTSDVIAKTGESPRRILAQKKLDVASGQTPAPPPVAAPNRAST
jgi:lambda family phage portal protein